MDFYKPFHDLFNEVAITNRRLLELLKGHENEEITELLLRQDKPRGVEPHRPYSC